MIKQLNVQQDSLDNFTFSIDSTIPLKKATNKSTLPGEFLQKVWTNLRALLNMLYKRGPDFEICYQELCEELRHVGILRMEEELFTELNKYYKSFLYEELEKLKTIPTENLLSSLEALWLKLANNMNLVTQILIWFERGFLLRKKIKAKTIEKLILSVLHESLNTQGDLKFVVIQQILNQIMLERNHNPINKQLIKNLVTMIIKIDFYKEILEPEFFKITEEYYKTEASDLIKNFEVTKYLDNADQRIKQEINRINDYLDKSTENKLVTLLEKLFVTDNLQVILSSGFEYLMENQKIVSLKQLYNFLSKVGKIDFLKKTWQYYVKTKGTILINSEDVSVEKILNFKNILDHVLNDCFVKNGILKNGLHYAFEDFINLKTNKIAELTSKYIDEILKKAHKMNMTEDELDLKLEEALAIFRFLMAKDVFEAFYTKRLVKRLLLGNVSSYELEGKMIEKLKAECGAQYTKKAEDIFKDFEISKTLNSEFISIELGISIKVGLEFIGHIFSTNSWPLKNNLIQKFPSPFQEIVGAYDKFYLKKYPGVRLFWQYETSTCELSANFGGQKYTLAVSLIQAIVLMLFNSRDGGISYNELEQIFGINPESLKGELLSMTLVKDKDRVLNKNPDNNKVAGSDVFSINDAFVSKAKRVKINSLQKKETNDELEQTTNRVLQERQYLLDAALVRIMKSKKTLSHNDLVNEVFNDLKLPISIPEIKKRIESLIERDYMTRDKDNMHIYNYVA